MANPPAPFLWSTNESVFPAGGNAWAGQPLAIAPSADYFQPSPATGSPVKIQAENLNYVLQQACFNGYNATFNNATSVATIAAFRALPVPTLNQTVLMPPYNGSGTSTVAQVVPTDGTLAQYGIGGLYYWDPTYNVVDNGSTAIRSNANPSGPGMWRLQGGPTFIVGDQWGDPTQGYPDIGATLSTGVTLAQLVSGGLTLANFAQWTAGPNTTQSLFLNDIIELTADVRFIAVTGSGAGLVACTAAFTKNTPTTAFGPTVAFSAVMAATTTLTQHATLYLRYAVTATDISNGGLSFSSVGNLSNIPAGGALIVDLNSYRIQVRRN